MSMSTARLRALFAVACAALTMSACSHRTDGLASAEPEKSLDADSLIVSLDGMRQLIDVSQLGQMEEFSARPEGHSGNLPAPCRALSSMDVAFDQTWTQFKGFRYGTLENRHLLTVLQAVGVYPDSTAARVVFEQLLSNMQQCSATHWGPYEDLVIEPQNPSNFTELLGTLNGLYRVKDNVVIMVTADGFPDSQQVAQTVMRTISDRITNA